MKITKESTEDKVGTPIKKPSEEFKNFDKAMDKIMSVSKAELDKRLAAAKAAKTGKRYPKPKED